MQARITDKQKRAIAFIERTLEIRFEGANRSEASDFIGEWLPRARLCQKLERTIGDIGTPVFSSFHDKTRDIDETYLDIRDSVSEVKFKGQLLRGRKPIDALIDLQIYKANIGEE